jgi:1-acyl-sn-glycerol-3-phosphate acyltransferase
MSSFEEEFRRVQPTLQKWIAFLLMGKKVEIRNTGNFVPEGPSIIVGNHCGAAKDVATVLRIVPRPVFFTANRDIFSQETFDALIRKHLRRHLGDLGLAVNTLLRPLKMSLVRFVSTNISKVGTIPVDLAAGKADTRRRIQEYLKKGRAIIALQGRGRVHPGAPHPYVSRFRPGTSAIAHNLFEEAGLSVPVTPLAIYGTQKPWLVPGTIKVNVGEPMFIKDYFAGPSNDIVERFRQALEVRVKDLFLDLLRD